MSNWSQQNSVITSEGIYLLAKARAGEGQMVITRVLSREMMQDRVSLVTLTMSDITPESIKQEGIIVRSVEHNGESLLTARFTNLNNRDRDYTYTIKQVIVLAKIVNEGVDVKSETPYLVIQCAEGEGDILPPLEENPTTFDYNIHVVHTGLANVNVQVTTGDYASHADLEELESECITRCTALGVRINKIVEDSVGQKTEGLTFIPWKPVYADDATRTWSRELSSLASYEAKDQSERFNYYNEEPDEDTHSAGYSKGSMSLGENSTAIGNENITYASNSFVEGENNYIGFDPTSELNPITDPSEVTALNRAESSHAEGAHNTVAGDPYQHIEGLSNFSNGVCNHTEGKFNQNRGSNCHVGGTNNIVGVQGGSNSCDNSTVSGALNNLHSNVDNSNVSGQDNFVDKVTNSVVTGMSNNAEQLHECIVTGYDNVTLGESYYSEVHGTDNQVKSATGSRVGGSSNRFTGVSLVNSFIHGMGIKAAYQITHQLIFGKYNDPDNNDANMLTIANGSADDNRRNILELKKDGNLSVAGSVTSGSADLAEYFEWKDGNKKNQDRRGLFVTLDEDKIVLADNKTKYIVGCISAAPALIANNPHEWESKYKTDVFGSVIYDVVKDEKTGEEVRVPVLNEEYDASKTFIPRSERKEWGCVALHGRVVVVDDGSCEPNSYCRPIKNGIASKSDKGFRVLKRIDKTHILVWIEGSVTLD